MAKTSIEWTEATWNPVTGCSKISAGCQHCYAERMARRLKAMGQPKYRNGFEVTLHPETLFVPLTWRKPKMAFVNSMSDLFHEDVPVEFVMKVFQVMTEARLHTFQVLTKRDDRLVELDRKITWPDNVWMGVTVERDDYQSRLRSLKSCGAAVKFVSFEPLLGPIRDVELGGIDWAIVGGESGPCARPMDPQWALDLRDACLQQSVPFFFKQWGGTRKKKASRLLDGREWNQLPAFQYAT
jgi:protein gp37